VIPSAKYSRLVSPLKFFNGRTTNRILPSEDECRVVRKKNNPLAASNSQGLSMASKPARVDREFQRREVRACRGRTVHNQNER